MAEAMTKDGKVVAGAFPATRNKRSYWHMLGYVGWLAPLFWMAGCYALSPLMKQTVSLATLPTVYGHLLATFIVMAGYIGFQVWLITNRTTPIGALQFDITLSNTMNLGYTLFGGWMLLNGTLPWFFLGPWIAVALDHYFSGPLAVNNAATRRSLGDESVK